MSSEEVLALGTQELSDSLSLHPSPLPQGTEALSERPPGGTKQRRWAKWPKAFPRGLRSILSTLALPCLPVSLGSCGPTH